MDCKIVCFPDPNRRFNWCLGFFSCSWNNNNNKECNKTSLFKVESTMLGRHGSRLHRQLHTSWIKQRTPARFLAHFPCFHSPGSQSGDSPGQDNLLQACPEAHPPGPPWQLMLSTELALSGRWWNTKAGGSNTHCFRLFCFHFNYSIPLVTLGMSFRTTLLWSHWVLNYCQSKNNPYSEDIHFEMMPLFLRD